MSYWLRCWALVAALALCAANPGQADEISDAYARLQANPASVTLNLEYGAAAERGGKLKWALPAYERALMADPGNTEARNGIERVRRKIRIEANAS